MTGRFEELANYRGLQLNLNLEILFRFPSVSINSSELGVTENQNSRYGCRPFVS